LNDLLFITNALDGNNSLKILDTTTNLFLLIFCIHDFLFYHQEHE